VADQSLPLSVWPTAQQPASAQRTGWYLPGSTAHPAKMLPAIARHAIAAYSQPGELVLDPMCGIGTTLVEATRLGRDAVGVDLEPRWADLAYANLAHARTLGATGSGRVVTGDARRLPDLLGRGQAGRVALVVTSPPYGSSVHGQVDARPGRGVVKYDHAYSADRANLGRGRAAGAGGRVGGDPGRLPGAAAPRRAAGADRPALAPPGAAGRFPRPAHPDRRSRRPGAV
jgi:modification methylase